MSNEAFEKWAIDYGLDYESSFTRDDVEASWQAAKADSEREIADLRHCLEKAFFYISAQTISKADFEVFERCFKSYLDVTLAENYMKPDGDAIRALKG